jgi:hypothetical protein
MNYNENSTSTGHACGTDLTPYDNTGALCTISGTDKNCNFSIDLTTINGGVGIAADSCFQLQVDGSGTPGQSGDVIWEMTCSGSEADTSGLSAKGARVGNTTFYCGSGADIPGNCDDTLGAVTHFVNWSSASIDACKGWFALEPAPSATPNATKKWVVDPQVSTAAVGSGETCADLTYDTLGGCEIGSTNRSCATGAIGSCVVPGSGGCYRFRVTPSGSPRSTSGGQKFNFDVSGGGFALSRTGSWGGGSSSPYYLANHIHTSSTDQLGFVLVPYDLTTCDGGIMQTTAVPASNQADLEILYSTAALTSGQKCSDLTYSSTGTLCSVSAGNKSCTFSGATVPATEGGCMRLKYVRSGTFGAGDTAWGWYCD